MFSLLYHQVGQPRTIQDLVGLLDTSQVYSHLLDVVMLALIVSNSTIWPAIYHKGFHKVLSLLNIYLD